MKKLLKGLFGALLAVAASAGVLAALTFWRNGDFERDHPAPGKLVGPPGALVHVNERLGSGAAVVLVHDNPGTGLDFEAVQQKLRARTLAVDRPGFGWSERSKGLMGPAEQARALHAAVRELGVERAVLVGAGWGAMVAVSWASQFPDETRALVLVAPLASPDVHRALAPHEERWTRGLEGRAAAWLVGPFVAPNQVAEDLAASFAPETAGPEALERARLHFARPRTLMAAAWDWKALDAAQRDVAARLAALQLPAEVLIAEQDAVAGPAHAEYVAANLRSAHLVRVAGAGHQLALTHPAEVAQAVERALARSK